MYLETKSQKYKKDTKMKSNVLFPTPTPVYFWYLLPRMFLVLDW